MKLWLVGLLLFTSRALAHGAPPATTELLALDARGAALVRLTPGGFAHRSGDGFRFVCPESWGGYVLAPAAAPSFGPALVASDELFVVGQDGRVARHPVQSGLGFAAASQRDAVLVVFQDEGRWELRRVTASSNELVRTLAQPVDALAGDGSTLRFEDRELTVETGQRTITWTAPSYVASAQLRIAAAQLHVVTHGRSAPWVTLGRILDGAYEPLLEASVDIAGPAGNLVAVDGKLRTLSGTPIETAERVTCLGEVDGTLYACSRGDLFRVDERGLGDPLFTVAGLQDPDYSTLTETARADCTTRWVDLRDDAKAALALRAGDAGMMSEALPIESSAEGCALHSRGGAAWLILALWLARRSKGPCRG
ncbi:MAG: hypothetical protein ABW352_03330 [Polyangiales bacterium]